MHKEKNKKRKRVNHMNKIKAKFNVQHIVHGDTIYPTDFVEMVLRYANIIIEVEEEVFGGYELELEGHTYALDDHELIIV